MSSKVARIDKDLKKEIRDLQEDHNQKTGEWIGEARALNIIMGRDKI